MMSLELEMIETESIPLPGSQSGYSESVLMSPVVGIDREKLRTLLLSSDSPFGEYKALVEEVSHRADSLSSLDYPL
jgi:hypothetical protein